jgi:peptidoglycan/xylan/chitin deacetylase (PgdA/CDA1 family)
MLTETASRPSALKTAGKQLLLASGYYATRMAHLQFPGVAVLCFHGIVEQRDGVPFHDLHVGPDTFAGQCAMIARHCSPISADDLRRARATGQPLPPRPVLVTFDDGYRSVLDHALPIMEQYRIPATVFVCSEPVERQEHFWYDAIWRRDGEQAVLAARRAPYVEWRRLIEQARVPAASEDRHRPLTVDELRTLARHPLIEIGAHTVSHPTLARAPAAEQRAEIVQCRARLSELIDKPINAFAYPYGDPGVDFSGESSWIVREAGFDAAFTTVSSFAPPHGDPWQIPRFVMLESVNAAELAHRLTHSWHPGPA